MESQIRSKIDEIASVILNQCKIKDNKYGLFTRKSGIILFLYYYANFAKSNKYKLIAENLIKESFININQLYTFHFFIFRM